MRKLAMAFGLYASLLTFAADRASSQSSETPAASPGLLPRACPPGHRVEFRYASTSLYVDLNWLDVISLVKIVERSGPNCPKQPIFDLRLFFTRSILDAAQIPDDLGRNFFFLVIERASERRLAHSWLPAVQKAQSLERPNKPEIADISDDVFKNARPGPSSRAYLLRYPAEPNASDTIIEISCGGPNPPGRECFLPLPYRFHQDLDINYKYRQPGLPIPGISEPSVGSLNEPEGVLEFDVRLRAWIESLMQKP